MDDTTLRHRDRLPTRRVPHVALLALAALLAACSDRSTSIVDPDTTTSTARFTIAQTVSDEAQRNTIAFDALAFITGSLGADSFFPPGKAAAFWGFQSLRDNDPTEMGHNTDFLTKASLNTLATLTAAQRTELVALANSQVGSIRQYAYNRFVLMKAFRRLLEGDLPPGVP